MTNIKNDGLTVQEAAKEYDLKSHNIRRWIRKGYVNAEMKEDGGYIVDPVSLEEYLAKTKGAEVPGGDAAPPVTPTPPPTSETTPPIPRVRPTPLPSTGPVPLPPSKAEEPLVDLHAGPRGILDSGARPRSTVAKGPSNQQKARTRKAQRKEAHLEAGKKYKKGPVRYAKDAMRKFELAQMRDVRDWLLMRMDKKMRPV